MVGSKTEALRGSHAGSSLYDTCLDLSSSTCKPLDSKPDSVHIILRVFRHRSLPLRIASHTCKGSPEKFRWRVVVVAICRVRRGDISYARG